MRKILLCLVTILILTNGSLAQEKTDDISLNNLHIGSLEAQSEQHLAAYGTQTVTLPVSLDPNALLEAAKSVLLQGKANYNFNGNVGTSLGQVPFTKEGELSAKDILSSIMKLR